MILDICQTPRNDQEISLNETKRSSDVPQRSASEAIPHLLEMRVREKRIAETV